MRVFPFGWGMHDLSGFDVRRGMIRLRQEPYRRPVLSNHWGSYMLNEALVALEDLSGAMAE